MSSEIVRYENTALVAGAMHRDITGKEVRSQLRKIYECIPQGESAIVEFCISTDNVASQGTRVHYAATAQFKNITGKSLNVKVTIASYQSGRYRTPEMPITALEDPNSFLEGDSVDQTFPLATSSSSSRTASNEIEVVRHPFIGDEGMRKIIAEVKGSDYGPNLVIAKAVQSIFPNGVPLPIHERFHYSTFTVRSSLESYPFFTLHRHVRGLNEALGTREESSSHVVQGYDRDGKEYHKAEHVIQGRALPSLLHREENLRETKMSTLTIRNALNSSPSGSSSQITEIKDGKS